MQMTHVYIFNHNNLLCAGELTSRLSKDTKSMGMTVCLNMNVLLRTFVKTVGMISLMMSLSWKLTFLVLMESPVAGIIQNVYDTYYQVLSGGVYSSLFFKNVASDILLIISLLKNGEMSNMCSMRMGWYS